MISIRSNLPRSKLTNGKRLTSNCGQTFVVRSLIFLQYGPHACSITHILKRLIQSCTRKPQITEIVLSGTVYFGQKPYSGFFSQCQSKQFMRIIVTQSLSHSIAMSHQIAKEGYIYIKIRLINIYFVPYIRTPQKTTLQLYNLLTGKTTVTKSLCKLDEQRDPLDLLNNTLFLRPNLTLQLVEQDLQTGLKC